MPDVLQFSSEGLLASHDIEGPLVLGGVRCHGGFLADGTYVSPRTKYRAPALAAWQEQHRAAFGTETLHAPVETWPANLDVAPRRICRHRGLLSVGSTTVIQTRNTVPPSDRPRRTP